MHARQHMPPRTADWISETMCNNSSHIRKIVEGRHRDLPWSRKQLHLICQKIVEAHNKARFRELNGEEISKRAKKRLLKSEFDMLADIRTSLYILRLGESGAEEYRRKVEDEEAKGDFERVAGGSRAFKIFTKVLRARSKTLCRLPSSSLRVRRRPGLPVSASINSLSPGTNC